MPAKKIFYTYAEAQAAVQMLEIKNRLEYSKRYREDSKLPASPDKAYIGEGWTNWYELLGNERPDFYPTYAEAQAAARGLGVKSRFEYNKRYREDPKLPGSPKSTYADAGWTDWYDFLGNKRPDLYLTYAEAQAAAQALSIKSQSEYIKRYRQDPKLAACPHLTYSDAGWTNWYDFLGNEKSDFYSTYAEAQVAARILGIKSLAEYRKGYCEDPKLAAKPNRTYANVGWIDWYNFLGNEKPDLYPTYVEARAAVQALGIKNRPEYLKRYREDPKLPASPDKTYSDSGWTDLYDFLGTDNPSTAVVIYPLIWADVEQWLKSKTGITAKKAAIKSFLGGFCQAQGLPDDAKSLLLRSNPFNIEAYQQFIEAQAESLKRPYHGAIKAFFSWLLDEYCTDVDADERIVLPEYRNPFETVLAGFADSLRTYRPSQSTKPPLGYEYILRARNYLVPNGEQVLCARR